MGDFAGIPDNYTIPVPWRHGRWVTLGHTVFWARLGRHVLKECDEKMMEIDGKDLESDGKCLESMRK